jgi:hypothetical protein
MNYPKTRILLDSEVRRLTNEACDPFTSPSRVKEIKQILGEHYQEKLNNDKNKSRVKRVNRI